MAAPLQVSHLTKRYAARWGSEGVLAVNDISFEVSAGECFGLLGPNGAGKSTTIQCISGFYPPTSGEVLVDGHNVHSDPKAARNVEAIFDYVEGLAVESAQTASLAAPSSLDC